MVHITVFLVWFNEVVDMIFIFVTFNDSAAFLKMLLLSVCSRLGVTLLPLFLSY